MTSIRWHLTWLICGTLLLLIHLLNRLINQVSIELFFNLFVWNDTFGHFSAFRFNFRILKPFRGTQVGQRWRLCQILIKQMHLSLGSWLLSQGRFVILGSWICNVQICDRQIELLLASRSPILTTWSQNYGSSCLRMIELSLILNRHCCSIDVPALLSWTPSLISARSKPTLQ